MAVSEARGTPVSTACLNFRRKKGILGFRHSGLKAKALVNKKYVIVNRFGDTYYAAVDTLGTALLVHCIRSSIATCRGQKDCDAPSQGL